MIFSSGIRIALRKNDENIQRYFNAMAKGRKDSNSLARSLHKNKKTGCEDQPAAVAQDDADGLHNFKFQWLGCQLKCLEKIGAGTYGCVFRVQTTDGLQCAAKILKEHDSHPPQADDDVHSLKSMAAEATMHMRFAACPFVVPPIGVASFEHPASAKAFQSTSLLMEMCDGSLHSALGAGCAKEDERLRWCAHISAALCYLHYQKVLHGDLKLDNVMLGQSRNGSSRVAMLGDFGLARQASTEGTLVVLKNSVCVRRPVQVPRGHVSS